MAAFIRPTNQKLLIAILVVATLTLVTSVAITKEKHEAGETETRGGH